MKSLPRLLVALVACCISCHSTPSRCPDQSPTQAVAHGSAPLNIEAQVAPAKASFRTIVLGPAGGLFASKLSSYLIADAHSDHFVALDAGTMLDGLQIAKEHGSLPKPNTSGVSLEAWVMKEQIKAVLISHPHLDHVAGLVLSSPDDGPKILAALPPTLDAIQNHLFNNIIWANFANEGPEPRLNRYTYLKLAPTESTPLQATGLRVEAWPLSHAGGLSTAFLLTNESGNSVLYLGDTGPDSVEKSTKLNSLWSRVAPLVKTGALKGLFIEVSYPNGRPDNLLFGHLTPTHFFAEMKSLATKVSHDSPTLNQLTVVITHIKPTLDNRDPTEAIRSQLQENQSLRFRVVIPQQGETIWL